MLPSSTVENYLKAIHQQQVGLESRDALVPMGVVAASMGVSPGTATSMVKALAEANLVRYEPYAGVRLLAAGERLARLVIRRHRLVELFLVKVMGFRWDEVHEEAEQLEHVVSERLIERIDEMLGRPETDPHGDPIPTPEGEIAQRELYSLLSCPLGVPLRVTRVTDQDAAFLRFLEEHDLKPGQEVRVERRDELADSVRLLAPAHDVLTIGARAASKVLVEIVAAVLLVITSVVQAYAQPSGASVPAEPFQITDNSFFIEEAFNQEAGIFQNIVGVLHDGTSQFALGFTQEWPAPSMKHQLSYTLLLARLDHETGFGDVLVNYRYQLFEEGPGRAAVSPRLSVILPAGDARRGLGAGGMGWQVNVPISRQFGDAYVHVNAGLTWFPRIESLRTGATGAAASDDESLSSPFAGASAIYRLRPMFHLMLESLVTSQESVHVPSGTSRSTVVTLSPGARGGWNSGDAQIVLGASLPVTRADGDTSIGVFGYVSYELPFKR